jgi:hypothetical protein
MESLMEEPMEEESESGMDPPPTWSAGCEDYAKAVPDGAGSLAHGQDPVAVAASNNPLLKTLTASVSAS